MTKQDEELDCPHCGQDLRLSPDAKDEIEVAFGNRFQKGRESMAEEAAKIAFSLCESEACDSFDDCYQVQDILALKEKP